jgi:YggT family protein
LQVNPLLIDNKVDFRYFSLETTRQLALIFFSFWKNLHLIFYSVFILGNLLQATAQILNIILQLYMWVIIIRALLSWVNPDPYNPIVQFLYSITEPVLYRIRQLIPMSGVGIDFSPIIVLLAIVFLQGFLVESLAALGASLQ